MWNRTNPKPPCKYAMQFQETTIPSRRQRPPLLVQTYRHFAIARRGTWVTWPLPTPEAARAASRVFGPVL